MYEITITELRNSWHVARTNGEVVIATIVPKRRAATEAEALRLAEARVD
jgi:hypothetical protein